MLTPGSQAMVTVRVRRERGFKGRVPVDVRNLPYGVIVKDVGLNGVLITEEEDGPAVQADHSGEGISGEAKRCKIEDPISPYPATIGRKAAPCRDCERVCQKRNRQLIN
jgi:hypothetical protein